MDAMWAVVPVKDMTQAKQRLAPALPQTGRTALYQAMLEDVLAALKRARGLAGILVVSGDPAAAALATNYGARVLGEAANLGHTQAVLAGIELLRREGVAAMLTLPGDVPLVTAAEIEAVLAAHGPAPAMTPAMTIVPSRDEDGSNCIALSPVDAVPLRFGDSSFRSHLAAARARGIEPKVLRLAGIGLDIDTPADLEALIARSGDTLAHGWLARNRRGGA
ncbi:MAG: 2-phospho-L-lactate guanylyltransferase [Alphaproteobacteria bacterium]|nr:2-phospho-L-lactate guanylyltransferase [Alphaproteobacteria bacterium]